MSRLFAVPDDRQLHASSRFARDLRWMMTLLAKNGAVGPRMLDLLLKEKWPAFLGEDDAWRWLYVARCATTAIVKIGVSADPVQRMVSLNATVPTPIRAAGTPYRFELIGALPCCSLEHESFLCEMFADSRAAGREWFRNTVGTRILCFEWARARSSEAPKRARSNVGWAITEMFVGLRYVSLGIEPSFSWRYGLNQYGQRCGVCRSRRHKRRECPHRFDSSVEAA